MARVGRVFRRMVKSSGTLLRDHNRAVALTSSAARLAHQHENPLRGVLSSLGVLIRMVRAWTNGHYREVPWRSLTLATAAILYFVSPIDAIADFIPVLGYVDDVMVVAWVANAIRRDLDRFEDWEQASLPA